MSVFLNYFQHLLPLFLINMMLKILFLWNYKHFVYYCINSFLFNLFLFILFVENIDKSWIS